MLGLLLTIWSLHADWVTEARRLTAGTTARREALARLRSDISLDESLKTALRETGAFNSRRFLALDVITALRRRDLLPELVALSADEESGFFYLTINGLVVPSELAQTAVLYRDRLGRVTTSPVARMILIDSLARMSVRLERREIEKLIPTASPEVKSSLLAYVTRFREDPRYAGLSDLLTDSRQRREQAR